MDERKESSIEKEKDHEVNNRMAERKKSPIEEENTPVPKWIIGWTKEKSPLIEKIRWSEE